MISQYVKLNGSRPRAALPVWLLALLSCSLLLVACAPLTTQEHHDRPRPGLFLILKFDKGIELLDIAGPAGAGKWVDCTRAPSDKQCRVFQGDLTRKETRQAQTFELIEYDYNPSGCYAFCYQAYEGEKCYQHPPGCY